MCLRYGPYVRLVDVVSRDASGQVDKVKVEVMPDYKEKVNGVLHWVSKEHSEQVRVNLYQVLLTEENAIAAAEEKGCDFTEFLNPDSLKVCSTARIWNHLSGVKVNDRFQFERVGYFCVD